MPFSRRSRYPGFIRTLLGALLLIALAFQPVLASLGSVHELTHAEASTAYSAFDDVRNAAPGSNESGEDRGDTLHFIAHLAHCCGHAPSALFGLPATLAFIAVSCAPDSGVISPPTSAALQDVLRPPIRA